MLGLLVALALPRAAAQEAPPIDWDPLLEVRERLGVQEGGGDATWPGTGAPGVEQRVRLGLSVERLGLAARVSFQDVRGTRLGPGPVVADGGLPSVAEGWVRVRGDLTRNVGATVTLGRQAVCLDEGRLLGTDPWSAEGHLLDAARVVARAHPFSAEYLVARRTELDPEAPGAPLQAVRVGAGTSNPATTWTVDALWLDDARPAPEATSTLGGYLRLDSGRWRTRADGYLQLGDAGAATLAGGSLGRVFGPQERLLVHLRYDGLSGSDASGGRTAWRNVLGDTRHFQGLLDRWASPESRPDGLGDAQIALELHPTADLSTELVGHAFSALPAGPFAGTELDGSVTWAFSPFADLAAGGGWFHPAPASTDADHLLGYMSVDVHF